MLIFRSLSIAVFLFCLMDSTDSPAEDFDIYILTGQSNSLGTTGLEGAAPNNEPGTDTTDDEIRFFWSNVSSSNLEYPASLYGNSGGSISTLQMQQGDGGVNPMFWGPEFGFARQVAKKLDGKNLLVIKASRGGGGNSLWDKSTFDTNPNAGHMWGHLRDTVDAGLKQISASVDTFSVKGLIYMQGESNNAAEARIADKRLKSLVQNLKSHINSNWPGSADKMFTVVVEIAASQTNDNRIQTTKLQQNLARHCSGFGFVATRDQPLKSDGIHFGRDAKLVYGSRIADAFDSQSSTASDVGIP